MKMKASNVSVMLQVETAQFSMASLEKTLSVHVMTSKVCCD